MIAKLIIIMMSAGTFAIVNTIECPRIECLEKPREDLLCYKNGGVHPLDKVTFYPCPSGMICDIDYTQ